MLRVGMCWGRGWSLAEVVATETRTEVSRGSSDGIIASSDTNYDLMHRLDSYKLDFLVSLRQRKFHFY